MLVPAGPGDTRTAHDLAADLHQQWRERLGDDHEPPWRLRHLASALQDMGRYAEARDLDEDSWPAAAGLGDDHPDTLRSANNLAADLRTSGSIRRPASWTRTSWPAAAACSARTTPTP